MNGKEKLKNDIMVGMMRHLDAGTMAILENVVVRAMQEIEIVITETLPATISDTNQYIIDLFMARKAGKLKERTVAAYMSTVREFIAFIHKPLNKVSECDVECYLYQKRINCENVSLNNLRRNLSAFFTWMRRVKLISDNPCDGVEPYIQVEKPIDHLEVVDVEKIKEGCRNKRDRAILEFLRSTAMRRGEVPLVHINDINFLTGKIVIYGGKSNRYRTVMLDKLALHFINEYLKERGVTQQSTEPLFTHLRGIRRRHLMKAESMQPLKA